MKRICCIVLLLLPLGLFAQIDITGMGFINLRLHERTSQPIETGGLDLYTSPNGDIIACFQKEIHPKYFVRSILDNQGNWEELSRKNSGIVYIPEWSDYYGTVLQYYEEKDGFIRIKINDKNYWINRNALSSEGGTITSWKTYFTNINNGNIVTTLYNMNLRTAPSANSNKVILVKKLYDHEETLYIVKLTGNFQGNWAEVNVEVWDSVEGYCFKENAKQRIAHGWIKYLDDKGFPNVFPVDFRCC